METDGRPRPCRASTGRSNAVDWREPFRPVLVVVALLAVMWAVEIIDLLPGTPFDRWGIRPRTVRGLLGVPLAPFLHSGFGHLFANTIPFVVLGAFIAIGDLRRFVQVTVIVGADAAGSARGCSPRRARSTSAPAASCSATSRTSWSAGFFAGKLLWIVGGIVVLLFYGGILWGLLPRPGISWTGHVFGAVGGVLAAWYVHGRARRRRPAPANGPEPSRATSAAISTKNAATDHTGAMERDVVAGVEVWRRLEPIHAVTYFSPEAIAALADAGYRGFWMGYFAGRAAPLGAVGPEVVAALFYNFARRGSPGRCPTRGTSPHPTSPSTPAAPDPSRHCAGPSAETSTAPAWRGGRAGRPGGASGAAGGPRAVRRQRRPPWPTDPLAVLWHAATLLREHRGDGHVAVLTAAASGRESTCSRRPPATQRGRCWPAPATTTTPSGSTRRPARRPRPAHPRRRAHGCGRALQQDIEDRTDRRALGAYAVLDDDELDRLVAALTPLTKAVVATGDIPSVLPIGLRLDDVDE